MCNTCDKYIKYKNKYITLKNQKKSLVGGSANKNTLYLFKAEWCGHCTALKSLWNELKNDNELKKKINFVEYDADKNPKEVKEAKIQGYPTLILTKNNKSIEYEGARTIESLKEFINVNL